MNRAKITCLFLAVLAIAAAPAARAQTANLAARLPANTIFYVYFRGTASIPAGSKNALGSLWNDPGFAPARQIIEQSVVDSLEHNPRLAGVPRGDLESLLAHPMIFGIRLTQGTPANAKPQSNGQGFLVVETEGKTGKELRAALAAKPSGASRVRLTSTGFLVYSENPATLADLARRFGAHAPAESSSLAAVPAFAQARAELRGHPTLDIFLRVPEMPLLHPQVRPGFNTAAFLKALHLERIQVLCGSMDLSEPGSLAHFAILGDPAPGGPFDLFGANAAEFSTLAAAPAGASYDVARLDLAAGFTLIEHALSVSLDPQQAARLNLLTGIFSASVLPALGGEYATVWPHPGSDEGPVLAITIHEKAAHQLFQSALASFLQPAGQEGDILFFRAEPPSSAPASAKTGGKPEPDAKSPTPAGRGPSFIALTPHLLLAGHDEQAVRRMALAVTSAHPPAGLAAEARFQAARATLPAELSGFGYFDLTQIDWTRWLERTAAEWAKNDKNPQAARHAQAIETWAREGGGAVLARHLHLLLLGAWKDSTGVHWRGDLH